MKKEIPIRIIVIGVGGAGCNVVEHMINEGIRGVEFMIANTDVSAFNSSQTSAKIQLGLKLTKGLDSSLKPSVGRDAALESYDELRTLLTGVDIVFITAGLGGGTGTGASPVVARIAKEIGALTIAIVTKPFTFEGRKRARLAEKGLYELKRECDSMIVVSNDKLLPIINKSLGMKEGLKIADAVLTQAVNAVCGVISTHDDEEVTLDIDDLKVIMKHRGKALVGIGEYQGEDAAHYAIKLAIESPLMDSISIKDAKGVLVQFHMHHDFPIMEMCEAMEVVHENTDTDADIVFGTTLDINMPVDAIRITLIATGLDNVKEPHANNRDYQP